MDFSEQRVLISGASRGIGRAIAVAFAARGASVALLYRDRAAAEQTLAEMAGDGHTLLEADIRDPQQVAEAVDKAVAELAGLDVVVNNAGIFLDHPLAETDYETWQAAWRQTLDCNLIGPANICYCAAWHMLARGGGRIVNVSSRGAFRGEPDQPAYGASKAGLNALTQSLAVALAPHDISVAAVAPGFVETDMTKEHLAGEEGEAIRQQSPFKRIAKPEEVAYAVLFLASREASFTSGTIVDVNGASYLRS